MKAVLIGTAAYKDSHNDIDLICDQEFADKLSGCETHEGPYGTTHFVHGEFEATVPKSGTAREMVLEKSGFYHKSIQVPGHGQILTLCAPTKSLIALKKAHLILPHKWKHHIEEYGALKSMLGVGQITVEDLKLLEVYEIYKAHRKESLDIAKAHPKLNTSKNSFFEEADFKIFDHDTIHKGIALGDVPAYTLMLDGEVNCSRKKWRGMSEEQRFNCVQEEAAILALERSILPALYLPDHAYRGAQWAYEMAFFKICTTITSGWFRDYCIERYQDAVEQRPDFINAFFEGLKSGVVKILKPEVVYG